DMNLRSLVPLIFLCLVSGYAGTLPPATVERVRTLTMDGINQAYNFNFDGANKSFDEAIGVEPLHPRPYVGRAMIAFWRCLLSKSDSDIQSFYTVADRAAQASEKFQDTYGDDAEAKLCLGTIYGYRAFVYGRTNSYFKAAWDARKSYDYFGDALRIDSHC